MSQRSRARRRKQSARAFPLFWVVLVIIAIAGVVAVVLAATTDDEPTLSGPQTHPVSITGDPLAAWGTDPDPSIGAVAPELDGQDFAGNPVTIAADGRPKAIVFLAHWCPHCQAEVPRLSEYVNGEGLPEDVDLYLVPTSTSSTELNYPPEPWLADADLTHLPILVDSGRSDAFTAMGGTRFPYWVFLDGDHTVLGRFSGEFQTDDAYANVFAALAAGQPVTLDLVRAA